MKGLYLQMIFLIKFFNLQVTFKNVNRKIDKRWLAVIANFGAQFVSLFEIQICK